MQEYLRDSTFLSLLDSVKIKTQYIKLTLLTFDEKPIEEISGIASAGTLNINGSAAVRRTISLTMQSDGNISSITDLNNLISANKKIKILVGYKNPFKSYAHYGDIIWFPCGVFVISDAQLSNTTSGCTISLNGKDKMTLLDGTVGGVFPASVTFHEYYIADKNGDIAVGYPTIYSIIQEAVAHYGEEPATNIFINDLDTTAKLLVKYAGDDPIWFTSDYSSFIIGDSPILGFEKTKYIYGQDVGYMKTDLTYPGELIMGAGQTVANLLDKICKTLGNYEYFYDVDGHFIFQEKKNYSYNSYSPITSLQMGNYIKQFSDSKYAYSLTDSETAISFNNNPSYDNIKNDFIVWGTRTSATGQSLGIRYHLAIDEKPSLDLASQYMWKILATDDTLLRYAYTASSAKPVINSGESAELISTPCFEWREELYRQALEHAVLGDTLAFYDAELLAEWRLLFDPMNDEWKSTWDAVYGDSAWEGWNPDVYIDPGKISYWLDFIDTGSALGYYSVNKIGRRSKVINSSDVTSIYNMEVPDIVFVENPGDVSELNDIIQQYQSIGQPFCLLNSSQLNYFSTSSTGASAYDNIREMLYQYLIYNTSISISCLPKYYLEPNNLIYVQDSRSGLAGSFVISQMSLPLSYTGTMTISANEAITRG